MPPDSVEITEALWELLPPGTVPDGRVTRITERPGYASVGIEKPHATDALVADLNALYANLLSDGTLIRHREPMSAARPLSVRYEIDTRHVLPPAVVCYPMLAPGRMLVLIRDGEMSQQAAREINEFLDDLLCLGLWEMRWDTMSTPEDRVHAAA